MIPNTLNLISSSPLKKHVHYAGPLYTVNTLDDFLTLKSQQVEIFQFPSPHKIESPTNSDIMTADSGSPNEAVKEESSCTETFQPLNKESFTRDKQEILIPMKKELLNNATRLNPETTAHKDRKIQQHYIRYDYLKPEPTKDFYEATDRDLNFLNNLNKELSTATHPLDQTNEITLTKFEKIIELLEHETGEGPLIPFDQALKVFTEQNADNMVNETTLEKIYNHWKGSREMFRRPLLRKYWRAAHKEEFNPNCAFQKRKENKFARRRSHRMSSPQDDLKRMKTLKKNMDKCLVLLANTKYREMLKLELQDVKRREFEEQVKSELGNDTNLFNNSNMNIETYYEKSNYQETKKNMMEYSKKGETIIKSITRLKELKSTGKSLKRKFMPIQTSTTSLCEPDLQPVEVITPTSTTMSQKKFSSLLPKHVHGSFTLPMRKSSIEVNDLKEKLKLSLGGLYLGNQKDLQVKVELVGGENEGKENINVNTKHVNKKSHKSKEHLTIKIDLKDHIEMREEGKFFGSTAVKYNVIFHKRDERQKSPLETIRKKIKTGPLLQLDTSLSVNS